VQLCLNDFTRTITTGSSSIVPSELDRHWEKQSSSVVNVTSAMANGRRSALDSLPTELIDCILGDLSLDDLRNLRLVSHGVNIAASSEHFKSFCRTKTVVLRAPALAGLKDRITPGSIAFNLQHLTITGVLSMTSSLEKILRTKTERRITRVSLVTVAVRVASRHMSGQDVYP